MKLQDYIHHYIGCRCFNTWFPEGHEMYDKDWRLMAYRLDVPRQFCLENAEDSTWTDSIKLILRKLSDITDDEKKMIWEIIFQRPFHESGRIDWHEKETFDSAKRWVLWSGVERVGIEMTGYIWADSDLHTYKFNPHLITHYLTTIGVDVFGLLRAGLAIDSKTLK